MINEHNNSDASSNVPTGPLEVQPGCWMVGHRNPSALLQCNTYVRVFERGSSQVNVCIDPGSQFDLPVVEANIRALLGDLGEIHSFSLNHQDPDVIGNAPSLCLANPNISAIVTEEVWRLVQHLNFEPRRIHFAETMGPSLFRVADEFTWQSVPTPFCHFRGAVAFYDPEIRTLFTGDLFGGLNRLGMVSLCAEESDWPGIAQFHQIYMPSREVLRYSLRQIRALDPPVEVIAPQHGHVITGDLVHLFLDRMHDLLVGHDLLAVELDDSYLNGYRDVLDAVLTIAGDTLGREEVERRLNHDVSDGLENLLTVRSGEIKLERKGYSAIVLVFKRLARDEGEEFVNQLRSAVLMHCSQQQLPIPPIGAGLQERTVNDSIGSDGIGGSFSWLN